LHFWREALSRIGLRHKLWSTHGSFLKKNNERALTEQELAEMEEIATINRLFGLIKARARTYLPAKA
jgi:hypothetical protein